MFFTTETELVTTDRARSGTVKIGYGRVSIQNENPAAQADVLRRAGCEQVFIEVANAALAYRPELDRALGAARQGDQLVVTKLDRLGRSLEHLIELCNLLQLRGIELLVLDLGIDTSTTSGRMLFQVLRSIAEFQHASISERTRDGLAAARDQGRFGGRELKLTPKQAVLVRQMYHELDEQGKKKFTITQIAAEFGVSRPTIYRYLGGDHST